MTSCRAVIPSQFLLSCLASSHLGSTIIMTPYLNKHTSSMALRCFIVLMGLHTTIPLTTAIALWEQSPYLS